MLATSCGESDKEKEDKVIAEVKAITTEIDLTKSKDDTLKGVKDADGLNTFVKDASHIEIVLSTFFDSKTELTKDNVKSFTAAKNEGDKNVKLTVTLKDGFVFKEDKKANGDDKKAKKTSTDFEFKVKFAEHHD